nr:protein transport protein SEC31 homolog B-like [Tanacetum cinerariifolium]
METAYCLGSYRGHELDNILGRVTGTSDPLSKRNLSAGGRHELSANITLEDVPSSKDLEDAYALNNATQLFLTPFIGIFQPNHVSGVVAMSWCPHDSSYLLTCAKDDRTILWDTNSAGIVSELPAGNNLNFDVHCHPKLLGVISSSFHGKIGIYNIEACARYSVGADSEGLHKGYDRSLPSFWSQVSLIMRTKPGVDTLNFDALYNNLRVFESYVKGSTRSSSSTKNVAFVSSDNTSSTNEVNTAYGVSTSFGYNSQKEGSSSYTDDLMYSFFANQSSDPQLDHEDLKQVDEFNLEEMDLKCAKLSASIATIQDTLLKSAYKKGIKTVEGEMQETLDTRQGTMERDMQNKMNIKLWSLLIEKVLIRLGITCLLYGPKQFTTSESDAKTSDFDSCNSSSSKETLETVPKTVESKPKVINEPKVWSDAPIIEEYESDSDDKYVSKALVEQTKLSCGIINTVKHVKTPRQTIQDQDTCSQNPKFDQRDWAG